MILLPQDIIEKFGLEIFDKKSVTLANEEKNRVQYGGRYFTYSMRKKNGYRLSGRTPLCEPLLGQLVLERLDLVFNPLQKTITVNPKSPYLTHLKLKTVTVE